MKTALLKRLHARLAEAPYRGSHKLVLAVSGGLDSMVMLSAFAALQHVHGAALEVVHVHHGSGAFADESAYLVRRTCESLAVPCHVVAYAHEQSENFEYAAARYRHRMLTEKLGARDCAVLAHHRRDQAETLLMTLARGAGVATPLGMVARHGRLLRPLLDVARSELAAHAKAVGLTFMEDPTNKDTSRFRNAVRHEILPVLERFHGDSERLMAGFASDWRGLHAQLQQAAETVFTRHYNGSERLLLRAAFAAERPYLWPFLMRLLWRELALEMPVRRNAEQLRDWLAAGETGRLQHAKGWLWCDLDGVTWEAARDVDFIQSGRLGETLQWNGWQVRLTDIQPGLAPGLALQQQGYSLAQSQRQPEAARECYRMEQVSRRARLNVPAWIISGKRYALLTVLEWHHQGLCHLEIEASGGLLKLLNSLKRYVSRQT